MKQYVSVSDLCRHGPERGQDPWQRLQDFGGLPSPPGVQRSPLIPAAVEGARPLSSVHTGPEGGERGGT